VSATALHVIATFLILVTGAGWATVRWGSWRLLAICAAVLVGSAVLGVWAYSRRPVPEPAACSLPASVAELGTVCGFENPEDLEYVPSLGVVLVSEEGFGGRLLVLNLSDPGAGPRVSWPPPSEMLAEWKARGGDLGDADCPFPADPAALAPHGVSALEPPVSGAPIRVAFVSHRLVDGVVTDAVQLFDLSAADAESLRWRGCIHYPGVIGNDLALLRDGSLLATNFAPSDMPEAVRSSTLRGGLGFETGDVLRWSREQGWSHVPGTEGAIPNGIAVARDEREFYFADAGNSQVVIVPLAPSPRGIVRVDVGGAPNNLTVTASGTVLATVATFAGELPILCGLGGRQCRTGWAVWEIDPVGGTAVEILAENGKRLASATTALDVDNTLYIGSMADTRIGVYRRP
jgi:hypothetical protein